MGQNVRSQNGFTQIELILVIVIMGILSAYAVQKWPSGVDLLSQAEQLAMDLRHAQSLAMSRGESYRLSWTPGTFTYRVENSTGTTVATQELLEGVTMTGTFPVTFNGLGIPTNPGNKVLAKSGESLTVVVESETGVVRIP